MAQLRAALAAFTGTTRLYTLFVGAAPRPTELLVEAFAADEAVQDVGTRDVIVLSTSACLDLDALLGQPAALEASLADGTRSRFSGEISEAAMLGSDGGFARYRLRIAPWLWRLAHVRNSRVWQDKTVIDIVDTVFDAYLPQARWRWSDEVRPFMADVPPRSYCCQYREADLDFVRRILTEEGLCWRFEDSGGDPCMVLFADSSLPGALPDDVCSAADGGIRFHGSSAVERQDTVQLLRTRRSLQASMTTLLSSDYKAKQIVAAEAPTRFAVAPGLPSLEAFDAPGQYAYPTRALAEHHADILMQGIEARTQLWNGRSTVRSLRAGTRLTVTGTPLRALDDAATFTVLRVTSVGVNNLPPPARHALAELFGPIPELLQEVAQASDPEGVALAVTQATKSGYANCFEAVPADLPWRPYLPNGDGRRDAKPTAFGAQSAIVVGPDGSDEPNGADELYCDRLGRVRIRFHWQDDTNATCWVRVAQRAAGGGMGSQFLPRIGQEVLVQFLENDIDRPIVVGALYNGWGEGGIAPTPGGQLGADSDNDCFASARDHMPSGQGNLAGGNSPVWHGASGSIAGHRNMAAQWGIRSKEFGGRGYNQLLFDDTDAQGRVQLRCTHAATELNLGYLIHAADNYRGSFRGTGAELRTDAYGAVRAGAGVLITSYGLNHEAETRDPMGDNAAGVALLRQAAALADTFHTAATTHQTVGLAAPVKTMLESASGTTDNIPYPAAPLIAITAQDGFGANAGQSLQLACGETAMLSSGQDTQFFTGGQMRIHTGLAIGVLGGAVKAAIGLQFIAAKDAVDIQAQHDELKMQARDEVNVISANAHIDWAAAKRISLSTAGGANIMIEGGNIMVQCPGKITIQASKKNLESPTKISYPLPALPTSICVECLKKARNAGSPFVLRSP
ncbi:type VI secretion system tip protein VgrG [Massilia phosphatilytica]|nr:type VI secretion system tip protein VgrG [Massilia phosphatilytica]